MYKQVETKQITWYIAHDGSKFATEKACAVYEAEMQRDADMALAAKLPRYTQDFPVCGCDPETKWVKVSSEEELRTLKNATFNEDCMAWDYVPEQYPCWLLLMTYGDGYGDIVGTVDELEDWFARYIADIRQHIEEVG